MKDFIVIFTLIIYAIGVQFIGLSQAEAYPEGSVSEVYSYQCTRCGRGGAKIYIDGKMVSDNRDDYYPRGGGSHSWSFLFTTVYRFRDGQWVFDHREY